MTGATGIRVLIFNEHLHEQRPGRPREIYPGGIHRTIADGLAARIHGAVVEWVTLADIGDITEERLARTDVLVWWSHLAHDAVPAEVVEAVCAAVHGGLGLIALHSSAESRIFRRLMGTTCTFRWREDDDRELIWTTDPGHPIAAGIPPVIDLDRHEMYGEFFDIPRPDAVVFTSWFSGGEVFRSGCTFTRGDGRIFYLSPGHETYPVYHNPVIGDVLANAVRWAHNPAPRSRRRFLQSDTGWFER